MAAKVPPMVAKPRRFASPHPAFAHAAVEPIHQPMYSAYEFQSSTAPSEALFFQYAVGGTVAGNAGASTTATKLHTNLPAAGFFPTPKLFLVTGLRFILPPIKYTLDDIIDATDWATGAPSGDLDTLEDIIRIVYGSYLRLYVGAKDYLEAPSWLVPGNVGVSGLAALTAGTGATNAYPHASVAIPHTVGRYYAFDRYPILIPSQQNFSVSVNFPQSTKPTLNVAHIGYVVLDGILGREVA